MNLQISPENYNRRKLVNYLSSRHPEIVFTRSGSQLADEDPQNEHLHRNLYQLTIFYRGEGTIKIMHNSYEICNNSFYIINPLELHSIKNDHEEELDNITCRFLMHDYKAPLLTSDVKFESAEELDIALGLFRKIHELYQQASGSSTIEASLELVRLLLILNRQVPLTGSLDIGPATSKAVNFIHDNFTKEINMDAVAKKVKVNQSHLSRSFKTDLGISPLTYLHRLRLGYAAELLFSSRLKLSEIALESGFGTSKKLNQACQREFGLSASEFRKQHDESKYTKHKNLT